jgi:hypothetical protein
LAGLKAELLAALTVVYSVDKLVNLLVVALAAMMVVK